MRSPQTTARSGPCSLQPEHACAAVQTQSGQEQANQEGRRNTGHEREPHTRSSAQGTAPTQ